MSKLTSSLATFLVALAWNAPAAAAGSARPATPSREGALYRLHGCCITPRARNCEDADAEYLVGLAGRGDDGVIGPMMNVATCGDPAVVDVLAPYLRTLLTTQPQRFVRIVAKQDPALQPKVVFAAVMDASESIDADTAASVRETLRDLGKRADRTGQAAQRCLAEFDRTMGVDAAH